MTKKSDISILYVMALTQFAMPFMFSGVGITLPVMGAELHASAVLLGLVETVYLGAATAFLLPIGRWADLTDKNTIFKWGILLFTIFTLLLGFISSMPLFIVIRGLQGAAAALVVSTNMAIIASEVSKENIGKAMGFSIGAVYAGLAAGPFFGGVITEQFGWRWIYFLGFFPLMLAYGMSMLTIPSQWKKSTETFDWLGSIIITSAVISLIAGSAILNKGVYGYLLIGIGLIFCYLFLKVEEHSTSPLINIKKIKQNATLLKALLVQLLVYSAAFSMTFLFSIYLQTIKGLTPQITGSILMIAPILMAIFAPIFGRFSDTYAPHKIAAGGVFFTTIAVILCTFITASSPLWVLYLVLVLSGIGFAMFSSPNMLIIMNSVNRELYSIASSLAAGMRTMGMVLSMVIVTVVLAVKMGDMPVSKETAHTFVDVMQISFLLFAILSIFSLILAIKKSKKNVMM